MQFLVNGHLENFQRPQIALVICYRLVKYLVFDKITRFFVVFCCCCCFFFWNCVSTTLCCYLQVVPCHLRARFHIRFKCHARRVGQVCHFSMKICVIKTPAKPVTKPEELRQMIIRLHGKKVLFLPKKKRKKMNKLPDLYTYVHF